MNKQVLILNLLLLYLNNSNSSIKEINFSTIKSESTKDQVIHTTVKSILNELFAIDLLFLSSLKLPEKINFNEEITIDMSNLNISNEEDKTLLLNFISKFNDKIIKPLHTIIIENQNSKKPNNKELESIFKIVVYMLYFQYNLSTILKKDWNSLWTELIETVNNIENNLVNINNEWEKITPINKPITEKIKYNLNILDEINNQIKSLSIERNNLIEKLTEYEKITSNIEKDINLKKEELSKEKNKTLKFYQNEFEKEIKKLINEINEKRKSINNEKNRNDNLKEINNEIDYTLNKLEEKHLENTSLEDSIKMNLSEIKEKKNILQYETEEKLKNFTNLNNDIDFKINDLKEKIDETLEKIEPLIPENEFQAEENKLNQLELPNEIKNNQAFNRSFDNYDYEENTENEINTGTSLADELKDFKFGE